MSRIRHIIKRQTFEISLADDRDARDIQEEISAAFKSRVLPRMKKLFDLMVPADQVLQIDSLELDLGELSQWNLEEELPEKIEMVLEEELRKIFYKTRQGLPDKTGSTLTQSIQAQLGVFVYMLKSGSHPWNSPFKNLSLGRLFDELLAKDPEKLKSVLQQEMKGRYVRKRLVLLLTDEQICLLSDLLTTPVSDIYRSLISGFLKVSKKLDIGGVSYRIIRQQLLEDILKLSIHQTANSWTSAKIAENILSNFSLSLASLIERPGTPQTSISWQILGKIKSLLAKGTASTVLGKHTAEVEEALEKLIERENQKDEVVHPHKSQEEKSRGPFESEVAAHVPDNEKQEGDGSKEAIDKRANDNSPGPHPDRPESPVNARAKDSGPMDAKESESIIFHSPKDKIKREAGPNDKSRLDDKAVQRPSEQAGEHSGRVEEKFPKGEVSGTTRQKDSESKNTLTKHNDLSAERSEKESAPGNERNLKPDPNRYVGQPPEAKKKMSKAKPELHEGELTKEQKNTSNQATGRPNREGAESIQEGLATTNMQEKTHWPDAFEDEKGGPHNVAGQFKPPLWRQPPAILNEVYIHNAGLALLWPYLGILFKGIGWVEKGEFLSEEFQIRAVHLMQYMVTGETVEEEQELSLNKLLAGLAPEYPIPYEVNLTEKELEEAEHLLKTVLQNWKALKSGSIANLRHSFLQKNGILKKDMASWKLYVERSAIDILLNRLPWSYSVIKLPWMDHLINVEW